ncbi:hypothetical protein VTJ83DRAFT_7463 [Remersonia thermophila]|uniref:Amidohydrolase 3 domain-containing protein n=1 Tax=Remersonia thermophila TaxID=72144 RepID=A0ABR4D3L0_9PEZI
MTPSSLGGPASPPAQPSSSFSGRGGGGGGLRWAVRLSILAGVGGALLVWGQTLPEYGYLFSSSSSGAAAAPGRPSPDGEVTTYCYESVRLTSREEDLKKDWCFEVTAEGGRFGAVFARDSATASAREPHEAEQDKEERSADKKQTTKKKKLAVRKGHVLPGLWDGHGHLMQHGEFLHSADLFGASSPDEVRRRLREYLNKNPEVGTRENWVRGVGWDQMQLGGMPSADVLEKDPLLRGRFVMLDRVDVHCTWVSQAVLDLIPADRLREDVPGGEIVRDPGLGVFCDNAMDLVTSLWPRPGPERRRRFVASAMRELNKVGLVGIHDAGVLPADVRLYEDMVGDGEWSLRVYAMLECPERNTFCPDEAVKVEREDGLLAVRSVKLFADGALGSWGSALLAPYADRPDTSGSLLINASALASLARSWSRAGYQVNIHAIGDLANRLAIDALEAALRDLCPDAADLAACQSRRRFRIEHAQIIHPADQARLRELGIVPSIQPTHATSDMAYAARRLGDERTRTEAYRMRSLVEAGLAPVLGSDFPVEPPSPWEGLYAAVTRRSPRTGRGPPGFEDGWYRDEEALTLAQALEGFTRAPARAAFWEGRAGEIREGAFADWVVLDDEVGSVGEEGWRGMRVRETWVAGRRVYSRDEEKKEEDAREDL